MTKRMSLIIAALVILMVNFASADIIPENSHPINKCVKFVNLNDFPDVVLIGYYTGPMIKTYEAYQIENDKCLEKGYKFNSFFIYWTTKEKFYSIDLKDLKLDSEKFVMGVDDKGNETYGRDVYSPADLILLSDGIEPYGGYVDETNPLLNETIEYSVAGYSDGKLVFSMTKKTSEYNKGPEKVETFEKPIINNKEPIFPTPTPRPTPETFEKPNITSTPPIYSTPAPDPTQNPESQPVKKSFWNSISCFFKKLFGRSC